MFISPKPVVEITEDDMRRYVNEYILPKGLSLTYQNHAVNALKHFYGQVFKGKLEIKNLERPRKINKLPNVLSMEEVKRIITSPRNLKHRVMLTVTYSCGLRRGEVLNLIIDDVDSKRNVLIIRQGKGNKDRIVPLSQKVLMLLREYYKVFRPVKWLFEGHVSGRMYSEKSLESVLKMALKREHITKPVSLHWLRHSFATHLMENGTDLRIIQEILGHKSSKTTEIYTHVSTKLIQNIKSPIDDMDI